MQRISDYKGVLLNHLEMVHRPGDRDLAMEFARALNLHVAELAFTQANSLIAIHPEDSDRDATSNIIYLHQMQPAHAEFDALVRQKIESDPELKQAQAKFQEILQTRPGGTPHFGIRYRSMDALDQVIDRLSRGLSHALKERVSLREMPPYKAREGMPNIRQVFVYTDVITTSPAIHGQLIELQVDRE